MYYELVYFKGNKAYSSFYSKLRPAIEDRDFIRERMLASECYISGMSKYRIKNILREEAQ